jgi:hypothetical protein
VSWRQFVKAVEADARRRKREADRTTKAQARESIREEKRLAQRERELAVQAERLRAANEAEQFETYLRALVALHHECGSSCDWRSIQGAAIPPEPVRRNDREAAATSALNQYKPGILQRVFGDARKRIAELESSLTQARLADEATHAEEVASHRAAGARVDRAKRLASRVLAADASAYEDALDFGGVLEVLGEFQSDLTLDDAQAEAVVLDCLLDAEVVPLEEVKLTASGTTTTKEMASSRYWTLYQDHVCSASIRIAREALAVLPVSRVVVNVGAVRLNTGTGHREQVVYLSVHFTREGLSKLNLLQIDPSDSMRNFPHRMKFKKTQGFEPVERMSLDENWIST